VGALVSFEVLFLRILLSWIRSVFRSSAGTEEFDAEHRDQNQAPPSFREKFSLHVKRHGGPVTFWYQVLRLGCGLTLLALTVLDFYNHERVTPEDLLVEQNDSSMFGWVKLDKDLSISLGVTYVSHNLDLDVSRKVHT
jgi:hypothetical protein